ncbi:MAG: PepSY domain-containing protein [Porticoccus sp.]|nr:PepSY domain-containing protein [Porticoccus sp.]
MPLNLRKTIIINLRWHRRIGLSIVIMVIFLAITGLLLNHSPNIGLSKQTLRTQWLLDWYGFETTPLTGFKLENQWLSHPGGNDLFLNTEPVASCRAPLWGASQTQSLLLALCQDELVILTSQGELIEKLSLLKGLPKNTTALQVADKEIFILSSGQTLSLNIDTLETQESNTPVTEWSSASPLPTEVIEQLYQRAELPGISMETLILDLHSGRFFGTAGVLLIDLVGLLICLLALTGLWAWYSHHRLRKIGG